MQKLQPVELLHAQHLTVTTAARLSGDQALGLLQFQNPLYLDCLAYHGSNEPCLFGVTIFDLHYAMVVVYFLIGRQPLFTPKSS